MWGLVESSIAVVIGSMPPLKAFMTRTLERSIKRSKGASGANSRVRYDFDAQEEQSLSKSQAKVGSIPLEDRTHRSYTVSQDVKAVEEQIVRKREYY